MESKRATKEAGSRISCVASAMKANAREILNINFVRRLARAEPVSVNSVALASSVTCVVTKLQERTPARRR
jgi:hypothetical protein